jgi:hypothetical protein
MSQKLDMHAIVTILRAGRVGHGRAGWGRARLRRHRPGRSGPGAAEVVRGRSGVRRGQGGTGKGGWAQAPPTRGRVRRQCDEQLVAAVARVAIQRMEEMREREAGGRKGGAGYTRICSSGRHISR